MAYRLGGIGGGRLPCSSERSMDLAPSWCISSFQCRNIKSCFFNLPSLWCLVAAASESEWKYMESRVGVEEGGVGAQHRNLCHSGPRSKVTMRGSSAPEETHQKGPHQYLSALLQQPQTLCFCTWARFPSFCIVGIPIHITYTQLQGQELCLPLASPGLSGMQLSFLLTGLTDTSMEKHSCDLILSPATGLVVLCLSPAILTAGCQGCWYLPLCLQHQLAHWGWPEFPPFVS